MLAASIFCGTQTVLTSCTDKKDDPVTPTPEDSLKDQYGENKKITDGNYDKSLAVKCINGTFVGKKTENNVIIYKGIPFVGQQPVGNLRWKAPVDVTPDDGLYEAYYNGKSAMQPDGDPASYYVEGEDCLYLNVWQAAETSAEKKPVIVWIYGGAFETGGTIDPNYECQNFIMENPEVIVVTIAYRLGVYGFFHLSHLPDGKDYPDAQNIGLLDQAMALKWGHENIAGFGGDPDNVTIFGESAGGASCTLLALMDDAKKYFKRLITQSGNPSFTRSPEQSIAYTNAIMDALGCKTVADLQKISPKELADTQGRLFGLYQVLGLRTWPERDGRIVPTDPHDEYAKGVAKDIDVLQGCNKDEMNCFVSNQGVESFNAWGEKRKAEMLSRLTDEERALAESYSKDQGEGYERYSHLIDQWLWIAPLFRMSENQTQAGGKSYTYYLTAESSIPLMKSGHATDIPLVFNHPELTDLTGRAYDATYTKTIRKMWVQFAKTGNPSLTAEQSPDGKAKTWPLYDLKDKQVMVFDEFNIHPEKESQRKIVDWERTYFLTKCYGF